MTTSDTTVTRRRFGRMAAVGAMALVFAGSVAAPAEARRRTEAVATTNAAIGICFESGGNPYVNEGVNGGVGGVITTSCVYDDGSQWQTHQMYD